MNDIIFWGKNYSKFLVEAVEKSPKLVRLDESNNYKLLYTSTPVIKNGRGEFMILVRASDATIGYFARCSSITNLGSYDAVLVSPTKREVYDRIYPNAPYDIRNDEGETITITPPERFGEFVI